MKKSYITQIILHIYVGNVILGVKSENMFWTPINPKSRLENKLLLLLCHYLEPSTYIKNYAIIFE